MDHKLSIRRPFRLAVVLGVAALSFLTVPLSFAQISGSTNNASAEVYVGRDVIFKGTGTMYYRQSGTTQWFTWPLSPSGATASNFDGSSTSGSTGAVWAFKAFSGLVVGNTVQWDFVKSASWEYRRAGSPSVGNPEGTVTAEMEATLDLSRGSGAPGPLRMRFEIDAITIDFGDGSQPAVVNDPLIPQKEYEPGMILLDNQTGQPFDLQFGDEKIRVEPGLNVYPFYGEVDGDGLPKALPDGFDAGTVVGPDGKKYWGAALVPGTEGGPMQWQQLGHSVLPPPSSSSGPVIQTPGPNGTTNSYQLPKGMTPGNNLPIPNGVTPGSPGLPPGVTPSTGGIKLPEGVTPGTVGSLPNGVISGGSTHLPNGVSPGVKPSIGNPGSGDPVLPGPGTNPDPVGPGGSNEPTTDGDWTPTIQEKKPGAQHDLSPKITGLRGTLTTKMQSFLPLAPNQTLPKITNYTVNMPLPAGMPSLTQTLNFAQTPFPQIRGVILILFTLMVGVSFVRRITI